MKKIDVEKSVLSNGLRVISVKSDSDIFSIGVGLKIGSLFEDEDVSGISHLIEHMLFKGTRSRDMDTLNEDIENLAGDIDVYTTYHQTVMNANVMKSHARECMHIISDMLMNSTFPVKEFRLEKNVIIEEIKMAKDDIEDLAYIGLFKSAFPDTYYKYHIAGTIKSVRSIKHERVLEFYSRYYTPSNTVICIVSSYSHEEVIEMVNEYFRDWKGHKEKIAFPVFDRNIVPQNVVSHKKGIGQCHVLYGFDIDGLSRKEEAALAIINKKIGAGANSVLFRELRDKKGYTYSVYSDMDLIPGINMFYIYAGVSKENLRGTLSIIDNVVERFRERKTVIDEKDIGLIKDVFMTDTAIAMESPSQIVDYLLEGELVYNKPLEFMDVLSIMNTIDAEDIEHVIDRVLKDPIIHILEPS